METIKLRITGTSPLLMRNDRFSNPFDPMTKAHKEFTGKRKKTDEDHEAIAYSEWRGAMYFDEKIGPFVPGLMVEASLREGAKLQKLGKAVQRGVLVSEDKIKLEHDGPRTLDKLSSDVRFIDMRSVKVQQARLQRTRPKFDDWSLEFTLMFNPDVLDKRSVLKAMEDAGAMCGIGDFRPRFGRFSVKEI
jgi:hypothetical protein